MDKYIGKRLEGRYDILELVGKGGMANVYRAHDIIDDRTVAVKILRDEFLNNADFVRRFKNESKAIALLKHPNIVRVYDVSFSGVQYIVMEYINGVTLKEYMTHTGILPWKDAIHFSIQILHALQHAHDKGIVHRDIKPQNIMLLRTGEIKVTDFGIARFARSESRTISDRAIGSVHYISPEQAMGEYTDDKSDIYSMGIMLFEMLTAKLPFEADSAVSVAIQQIQTPIRSPRELNPAIPPGLEEITLRAAEKDPKNRYQSAAEMIVDLERFRENPKIVFGYIPRSTKPKEQGAKTTQATNRSDTMQQQVRPKTRPFHKKSAYLRIMLLLTTLCALGSAFFIGIMIYLNNPFEKVAEKTLPNFSGEKYDEIASLYPYFTFEEKERDFSDTQPKGTIYEQKPKAGTVVKEGSTVYLWVSKGQKEITVPDIIDMPSSRAVSMLREQGAEVVTERIHSETVVAGRVISTNPPVGSVLSSKDTLTLYVSEGPERKLTSVPDVIGMPQESAKALIEQSGFMVGTIREEENDLPKGTVIRQTPVGGSLEMEHTVVDLVVSKEGLARYSIPIPLPKKIDRDVTIRARAGQGDRPAVAAEEVVNPAKSASGVWSPSFSGKKDEVLRIAIYIDGTLYQEYELDFETGSHELIKDRSNKKEFRE